MADGVDEVFVILQVVSLISVVVVMAYFGCGTIRM
jgi:hypothetical protein